MRSNIPIFVLAIITGLGVIFYSLRATKEDKTVIGLSFNDLPEKGLYTVDRRVIEKVEVSIARMKMLETKMRSAEFYQEAAKQLARHCQSVDREISDQNIGYILYPKLIRELRPSYGNISPQGARVTFGGGFYPLGYILQLDKTTSTMKQFTWHLFIYSEEGTKKIFTLEMDKHDKIPLDKIVNKATMEFDRRIRKCAKSIYWHKAKIMFLLQFDHPKLALKACHKAIGVIPDHWWLRLTQAFIDSSMGRTEEASERFTNWVIANPSYSHYFYLFYYYKKEGMMDSACECILKSFEYPLTTSRNDSKNVYYMGFNMVVYAYENGRRDIAVSVCNAMEDPGRENERITSSRRHYIDFAAIKEDLMSEDPERANKWVKDQNRLFNPYQVGGTNAVEVIKVGRHYFPSVGKK